MAARPLRASSAPPARTAAPRQAAKTTAPPGPRPVPAPARTATLVSAPPAVRLAGHRVSTETRGEPIPPAVRGDIERTLGTSLAGVRVHTGPQAQNVAVSLSARAVTHGSHIFLGPGERADDLALIAHEAAHVVQQQGAPAPQRFTEGGTDPYEREAQTVSAAAVRGDTVTVRERTTPRVQRLGISDALDKLASLANNIPGFRMFTIVLGVNPINMSAVSRSAANIMRAIVEFIPGGGLITQALDNYGVFDKVGNWVDGQLRTLGLSGATIRQSVMDFVNGLKLSDLWDLGGVIERGLNIVRTPIRRIIDFAIGLAGQILTFIKDAILIPLARLAEGTRGYDLLKAVLGTDPVTGQPVPRTAETLIPGFLKLIGEEETWENMQKSRALPRAWAWFQSAMGTLLGFVQQVPQLIISTLQSLTIEDVVLLPRAFMKVGTAFAGFLGNFISWAGTALWNLLEIIFDVVSPGALGYIKKTGAALKSILKNPLPFVGNLVKAAMAGFENFAGNFLEHLKAGLIAWLTGSLPGVYIPKAFTLPELVKFVLSVLGLTWANIRPKLVKVVGETAVKAMETGFKLVVTLVTEGPAAFWEQLKGELANLKDQVIGGITDMVVDMVVKKAIPKLIAMFIPGAGFISAILSIYDTVMVFVQKIKTIIQVVTGFIDSIVAIAAGNISAAAKKVESILAGLLSLAISFLAGFAGLGKVADKVMGVIMKIRAPIDKAIDSLIAWVVKMAKSLFAKAKEGVKKLFNWASAKSDFKDEDGHKHTISVKETAGAGQLTISSDPLPAEQFLTYYLGKKDAAFSTDNDAKIKAVRAAIKVSQGVVTQINAALKAGKDPATLESLQRSLLEKNVAVCAALSALVGSDASIGKAREKYLLEGLTGTYGSMPKPKGDSFTADHQPQAAVLEAAAEFDYFSDTGELATRAAGRAKLGFAINLHSIRHVAGATFGSKGKSTKAAFLARVKKLITPGMKKADQRKAVVAEIRVDLKRDVAAMRTVAVPTSAFWTDVLKNLSGKKEDKEKLVKEISGRILAGESQMEAQNIDSLVD